MEVNIGRDSLEEGQLRLREEYLARPRSLSVPSKAKTPYDPRLPGYVQHSPKSNVERT